MIPIEGRYRRVLRLLPAWYRQRWEEDMVEAFLDSVEREDPEETDFVLEYGRPQWSEVASVAGLAVRLRLVEPAAPPRHRVWGQAVRLAVLAFLLFNSALAVLHLGFLLWLFGKLPGVPITVDDMVLYARADHRSTAMALAELLWPAAYLALLAGNVRPARLIVALRLLAGVAYVATTPWRSPVGLQEMAELAIVAALLLGLVAFAAGGAPRVAVRRWLVALPVAVVVVAGVLVPAWSAPIAAQWYWLDWPALCSLTIVGAAAGHLAVARWRRQPSWSLALALLAFTVLALRLVSLVDYLDGDYGLMRSTGLAEAAVVLAVAVLLAVRAARELRRLPEAPAGIAA